VAYRDRIESESLRKGAVYLNMSKQAKESLVTIMTQRGWSGAREYVYTACDAELYELAIAILLSDELQSEAVIAS
jgi:hypothetical protein